MYIRGVPQPAASKAESAIATRPELIPQQATSRMGSEYIQPSQSKHRENGSAIR
jgi:hypothetical protein